MGNSVLNTPNVPFLPETYSLLDKVKSSCTDVTLELEIKFTGDVSSQVPEIKEIITSYDKGEGGNFILGATALVLEIIG